MSTSSALNAIPISEKDLEEYFEKSKSLLNSVSETVQKDVDRNSATGFQDSLREDKQTIDMKGLFQKINKEDDLFSDRQIHILRTIRKAIQIARFVADSYEKRANVQKSGRLTSTQRTELNEKKQTSAAIAVFVMSRYVLWGMQSFVEDNTFLEEIRIDAIANVRLLNVIEAINGSVFFFGKNVEKEVHGDDQKLVAVVHRYFEELQQGILSRTGSLKYVEFFTELTYQLEDSDFTISGFALINLANAISIEFNRLEFKNIVGNRDAKHFMRMDAKRRVCYDFKEQKNPFLELGGVSPVVMGYGKPGTGKSMLIAAYATLVHDLCESLDIPFFFHPLPDNIVDSFQGNSAKNMLNWMLPLQDPTRLTWAPIDDAENILENRLHQGVSEGVKAAIGVFLRYTEGAYAINRGNSVIGVFTNLPENIDPAVLSRIQSRFAIDGARTIEDFLDQDNLWWSKFEKSEPGFVNMEGPKDYEWQSTQGEIKSLAEVSQDLSHPSEPKIREAFYSVTDNHDVNTHEFFAKYYMAIMKQFPLFSSRDVRNIQSAVNMRIMDFDLPDEWFEHPDNFVAKPYKVKMDKILELRKANMKGLSFAEIRLQETNRYLDNVARIADAEFQRAVEEGVRRQRIGDAVREAIGTQR